MSRLRLQCQKFARHDKRNKARSYCVSLSQKARCCCRACRNAAIARQMERTGFDAVYVSGAGMANATAGVPDIGLLTLTEVVDLAGYIAKAVKIPAIVDADTGFGGAENVARSIRELEECRPGRLSYRGPGISKTLRTFGWKIDCRSRRDGGKNQSCHSCAARSGFHDHRADGRARRRGFRSDG